MTREMCLLLGTPDLNKALLWSAMLAYLLSSENDIVPDMPIDLIGQSHLDTFRYQRKLVLAIPLVLMTSLGCRIHLSE